MAKAANYTPEMEKTIREKFAVEVDQKAAVMELAEMLGKTVASVRQKAVRMNLYKKAAYVSKTGAKPESKEAIVNRIAEAVGKDSEVMESLAKANKNVLLILADAVGADEPEENSQDSE